MSRVRFLPLPGPPSPCGVPLSQRHSQGLCCQQLPESACDKEQGGYPAHTSAVLPVLSHVIWGTLGHPHRLLSRSRALQWHPQPVAMPKMRVGALGMWGALPALTAQHQNFALRGKEHRIYLHSNWAAVGTYPLKQS